MQIDPDLTRWTLRLRTGELITLWAHGHETDAQTDEYVFVLSTAASRDEVAGAGLRVAAGSGRVRAEVLRIPVRVVSEIASNPV